jgi:hypothetical protein
MWLTVCGGLFSGAAKSVQGPPRRVEPPKLAGLPQPRRLPAAVTWADPGTRQIGLQHGGIPGSITAGNHRFNLAPEAPWPNIVVGEKVECVMEWQNGQWVVSRVNSGQRNGPARTQPFDANRIESFLGISLDFKEYAISDASGVKVVDLQTGKNLASPKWDRDWGVALSVAFGKDSIAVLTGGSVKVFSRKTGEFEQNVRGQIDGVAFTTDGRFLAITEFRPLDGYRLILRDITGKRPIADLRLGSNGSCSLAVAGHRVAAYESNNDQITVVQAETGAVVRKLKSGSFRKGKLFGGGRMPLAISPAGNLIACEAEDAVILYDIDSGKVALKLEGHLDVVRAVAFSPNGETVASAAKDKTIYFWNVKEGREITAIKNLPSGASELIFSSDGNRIAVVYSEGELRGARKAEIRSIEPKRAARSRQEKSVKPSAPGAGRSATPVFAT